MVNEGRQLRTIAGNVISERKATVNSKRYFLAGGLSLALAGCAGSATGVTSSVSASAMTPARMSTPSLTARKSSGLLYIASYDPSPGDVAVYSGSPLKYSYEITSGVYHPFSLALNSNEQLYVANLGGRAPYGASTVTVYKQKGKSPIRTFSKNIRDPRVVAVSSADDLYVSNYRNVSIFKQSNPNAYKSIHLSAGSIVFDSANNAYVATSAAIEVFAPLATQPTRTITEGINYPDQMVIDSSGNLYVGNLTSNEFACGDVTEYNAATGALENTITTGVCAPAGLALDSFGNLYVGSTVNTPSVTVYAADTTVPTETISKGVVDPVALAVDTSGNLYVANNGQPGNVVVYPPNQTSPSQRLTRGIDGALDLKWAP